MHQNPCKGTWDLAVSPIDYKHSSAKFYLTGENGEYAVTNYKELMDVDLSKWWFHHLIPRVPLAKTQILGKGDIARANKVKSLADLDNLPGPDTLAEEIVENLKSALDGFKTIIAQLKK